MPAKGITWDLSDLYKSADDPKLAADLDKAKTLALGFEKQYKPLFEKLNNGASRIFPLASLIQDYKIIDTLLTRPAVFAALSFTEKTDDSKRGAFLQKIRTQITDISAHLLFWEVSWNKLDDKTARTLMMDEALAPERHYLENLRKYIPHTLSETEEKIMSATSNTAGHAFARLFDETMNSIPFYLKVGSKRVRKTEEEVLNELHSPVRAQRKRASDSLTEGLTSQSRLLTYIFNMILADHRSRNQIRTYTHPMDPRNLLNETDLETVRCLIDAVKAAYPLVQRYYVLKKRLLGLKEMTDYDRYAPIDMDRKIIDFDTCREIVVAGYRDFSPKAGKIVEKFFTQKWIDAEIRPGKQSGGFCHDTTPDLHPYILVNYTGNLRDVMTVAHELGHGLHQYLARKAGILESHAPLTMAETASVFGEMIIFERLLQNEKDPKKKLALLVGKIDDNFATVFRQVAMTDFELMAHEEGLNHGELSNETLCGLWIRANSAMYGNSVTLTSNYRLGWMYIPHFVHSPFYCYAYSFAQLFVLSLFQKYKENKEAFLPNYFEMLSLGGSRRPEELAKICGIDISDKDFWKSGLAILDRLVTDAEDLAASTLLAKGA